uniref:(northern house mosquito) hypothetical protein n=1 Tax=Culex pipiens TaxID=7175 RepID=A0A8D8AC23_CULPI
MGNDSLFLTCWATVAFFLTPVLVLPDLNVVAGLGCCYRKFEGCLFRRFKGSSGVTSVLTGEGDWLTVRLRLIHWILYGIRGHILWIQRLFVETGSLPRSVVFVYVLDDRKKRACEKIKR